MYREMKFHHLNKLQYAIQSQIFLSFWTHIYVFYLFVCCFFFNDVKIKEFCMCVSYLTHGAKAPMYLINYCNTLIYDLFDRNGES